MDIFYLEKWFSTIFYTWVNTRIWWPKGKNMFNDIKKNLDFHMVKVNRFISILL